MISNHEPDLIAGLPAVTDAELAALHERLVRDAGAAGVLDVAYRTLDTPVGTLLLAATGDGLVRVAFASEGHDQVLESLAARVSPRILRAPGRLDEAAREIDEYFAGRRRRFDLPLDYRLSSGFRRIVLGHLPAIDYGKTVSYASVASDVGSPRAFRAVGTACATNPLPVVVPCHRVVKSGGDLGNYRGGPEAKRFLIDLEAGSVKTATVNAWSERVDGADWPAIAAEAGEFGCALTPQLLTPPECRALAGLYGHGERFRSVIDMGRYRFGEGEYKYFARPLPEPVERLKQALYPRLLPVARDWHGKLGRPAPWPDTLDEWLAMCHAAGQAKSTAILLRYGRGDWNALHRDLYGDLVFPLQVVVNLSHPGADHTGGEFLLLEQRPRAQSRGTAVTVPQGHGLVFTTRDRPVRSARGWSAAPVRHGVSVIRSGQRFTLGLVFHDAA